jgi:hypothetical protein
MYIYIELNVYLHFPINMLLSFVWDMITLADSSLIHSSLNKTIESGSALTKDAAQAPLSEYVMLYLRYEMM